MRTRTVALVALGLVAFAGCGGGTTGQAGPTTGVTATSAQAEPVTTTVPDVALPYEVDCGGGKAVAHKREAVPVVEAMADSWCAADVQQSFADDGTGGDTTVDDCAEMVAGAARLLDLTPSIPDDQMRVALEAIAGVVKGSAEACVEQGNTWALMGLSAVTGYAGALEQRMTVLGVQTVESDGSSTGYQP